MITGNTEVNKWRRVSAGSLTIRYTGYLTNPFSKLKSRRPPLYKGQTGQKRKHYLCYFVTGGGMDRASGPGNNTGTYCSPKIRIEIQT